MFCQVNMHFILLYVLQIFTPVFLTSVNLPYALCNASGMTCRERLHVAKWSAVLLQKHRKTRYTGYQGKPAG